MTVNVHVLATDNVGDLAAGPGRWFGWPEIDLDEPAPPLSEPIVLGGGGLGHESFTKRIERLLAGRDSKKVAIWSVGTNAHFEDGCVYPEWLYTLAREGALVGVRDYCLSAYSWPWVPCASAMSPFFDETYEVKAEVVVYRHAASFTKWRVDGPAMYNHGARMEEAVGFIASGEYVVTDSYHGIYWGILLGRKVIAYPFSSRHRYMKWKVPLLGESDDWRRWKERAVAYPEALSEARESNRSFCKEVRGRGF